MPATTRGLWDLFEISPSPSSSSSLSYPERKARGVGRAPGRWDEDNLVVQGPTAPPT